MRPILKAYIGLVAATAVLLVGTDLAQPDLPPFAWGAVLVLAAACAVADHLSFQVHRGWSTSAGAVPQLAAAFLLPPPVAALVAVAGASTRVASHRLSPSRAIFNLASIALNVWVAARIAQALGAPAILGQGTGWLGPYAALVASSVYYLVTASTVAGAVALDQRRSFWAIMQGKVGLKALVEVGLGLVGVALAQVSTTAPAWTSIFLFPAVVVYFAMQAMDAAERRARDLALTTGVGRAVAGTLMPERAFGAITSREVRDALKLDGIALVPVGDGPGFDGYVVADRDQPALRTVLVEAVERRYRGRAAAHLGEDGVAWDAPLAASTGASALPFAVASGPPLGVLVAWRSARGGRRPAFTPEELLVLGTLADYAAVALETARLVDETSRLSREAAAAEVLREVEALRQVARLKDEFVGQVSHELRTPLTIIHGYLEIVALGLIADVEQSRTLARPAYDSSRLMLRLVEDLLEMAHLDAGGLALHLEEVALGPWLAGAVHAFDTATASHTVRLDLPRPEKLPPVQADLARLGQVLNNLLSNAVRYAPAGTTVTVSARALAPAAGAQAAEVELRVVDQGPGVPPDERSRIFEKFYRGKNEVTNRVRGTGLGLAVARALVEAHHGTIGVEAGRAGQGAAFWVRLPALAHASHAASLDGLGPGPALERTLVAAGRGAS